MKTGARKTLLLVDDEPIIVLDEKTILEHYGYTVLTAASGAHAVEIARATPGIDLILMDINLGAGMDGTEAAAIILRERDIPVVFLSSHTDPETVERTESITSYGYIVKNSGETVLIASIKMAFRLFETRMKEKKQREALRLQALVLDQIKDLVTVTDLQGVITYVNQATSTMFNRPAKDIIGQATSLYGEDEGRGATQREIVETTLRDGSWLGEIINYTPDGAAHVMDCRTQIVYDEKGAPAALCGVASDITERKRSEETYREKSRFLTDLIENSGALIIIKDTGGAYQLVNRKWEETTGLSRDDVIGKTDLMLFPEAAAREFMRNDREVMESGRVRELDEYLPSDSGTRSFLSVKFPLYSVRGDIVGVCGMITETTERMAAMQTVRHRERFTSAILETAQEGFGAFSAEGSITEVNDAMCRMFGYTREELLGKRATDLIAEESEDVTIARLTRVMSGTAEIYESRHRRKDGGTFPTEVSLNFVGGDESRFFCFLRDISERKRMEDELRRQLVEKDLLLRETHHRIKNNIASISSLLSLQANSAPNPAAAAALREAISRVMLMSTLYEKMLIADQYRELAVDTYLSDITDSIMSLFAGAAKITVEKRFDAFILGSKKLFHLGVIANELLTNTMKYAFADRDAGKVSLAAVKSGDRITFTIRDDGRGMPDGFAIDASPGFGIMLVKLLSQELEGTISLEGAAGTAWTLTFVDPPAT